MHREERRRKERDIQNGGGKMNKEGREMVSSFMHRKKKEMCREER